MKLTPIDKIENFLMGKPCPKCSKGRLNGLAWAPFRRYCYHCGYEVLIKRKAKAKIRNRYIFRPMIEIIITLLLLLFVISFIYLIALPANKLVSTDTMENLRYDNFLKESMEDEIIYVVSAYCSYEPTKFQQIHCVHEFVSMVHNFNKTGFKIVSPDELVNSSGDCKSYTNFYRAVLDTMNISNKIINLPNHVHVLAYGDRYYCNLDQYEIHCQRLRAEQLEN